jgi:GT2 family glycosyltransferase
MISIVVCSRDSALFNAISENITATIGCPFEIVCIDNHNNHFTICSAYNQGMELSKFPYLCFVHEDVLFRNKDWGYKLVAHLQDDTTGFCGVAGGELITRIPSSWNEFAISINMIQSDKTGRKPTKRKQIPRAFAEKRREVVSLDGVMLCAKREIMKQLRFDEDLPGFHGYDFDICMQSVASGYTNYVMYDIEIEHFSRGNSGKEHYISLLKLFRKWEHHLPATTKQMSPKQIKQIPAYEKKGLFKLAHKLSRRGFERKEIKAELNYFARAANIKVKPATIGFVTWLISFCRI